MPEVLKLPKLKVGFPLYNSFDSLDVLGPYQTFFYAGFECHLIAASCRPVESLEGVAINPSATFDAAGQMDVLFVPGGSDIPGVLKAGHPGKNAYLDFLGAQAPGATLVCSVCTGALLLAAAGLLDGHLVTTHWALKDVLKMFPCTVVDDYRRYVQSGNRVTGAGISSGLDESLYIVSVLAGVGPARSAQLAMQYRPQPPVNCGDPEDRDIRDDPGMIEARKSEWGIPATANFVRSWIAGVA
jgi:transcriptional regulator GlxA family with amidase domain